MGTHAKLLCMQVIFACYHLCHCDDGGARKPFLLSLDKHENILTMSGTSRQLPGRPGEKSPASSPQLLLLNIWMWEHSLNPINLENTKQTDIYL